jgi:hypothetical protein
MNKLEKKKIKKIIELRFSQSDGTPARKFLRGVNS